MKETMKLKSGAVIPCLTAQEADKKNYLTRALLSQLHLMPKGDPCAFTKADDGSLIYYFDPERVIEAPPEVWYEPKKKKNCPLTLDSGTVIEKMGTRRAAEFGYYTAERLSAMNYDIVEEPVAYSVRSDRSYIYFYDKKTAVRRPLLCVNCGQDIRYKRKLCRSCFEEDLIKRRAEGDEHRSAEYGMDRSRVLFFDLELTGVYDHDEIISISLVDGNYNVIMDTFVKPAHKKRWKKTEKIHGITPEMVEDSPLLDSLIDEIKEIFANADVLIAYGVSTDYSHIKYIYDTEIEREALHEKTRCCANEFVRYMHEHHPDMEHASLVDAMECMGIAWDGIPHSSIADTIACAKVWEALFPKYYKN